MKCYCLISKTREVKVEKELRRQRMRKIWGITNQNLLSLKIQALLLSTLKILKMNQYGLLIMMKMQEKFTIITD